MLICFTSRFVSVFSSSFSTSFLFSFAILGTLSEKISATKRWNKVWWFCCHFKFHSHFVFSPFNFLKRNWCRTHQFFYSLYPLVLRLFIIQFHSVIRLFISFGWVQLSEYIDKTKTSKSKTVLFQLMSFHFVELVLFLSCYSTFYFVVLYILLFL